MEARFKAGRPLSILDGVPIGVKDEIDIEGFPTLDGTDPSEVINYD